MEKPADLCQEPKQVEANRPGYAYSEVSCTITQEWPEVTGRRQVRRQHLAERLERTRE